MSNTKTKRTRRTEAEIIAEAEAKIAKAKSRAARKEAMSNPEMAPLIEQLDDLKTDIVNAKRILGTGAQSAEARRQKHLTWIERIDAEENEAHATLSAAETRKAEIEVEIQNAVEALTSEA